MPFRRIRRCTWAQFLFAVALPSFSALAARPSPDQFHFAILGDRTGDAQPGVYEQVSKEVATEQPAFLLTSGDTIQGGDDAAAESQWRAFQRIRKSYIRSPLYLIPGNHDIWSPHSAGLFRKYAAHPLHYSFDYRQAHFTILDNSDSDELSAAELAYLRQDLELHASAPVKFIFSHRPSWLVSVAFRDSGFPLHQLARQYGVQYVVAGHIHRMLRLEMQGVTYISMPSSGGNLRLSKAYEAGWFFGHALVVVRGPNIDVRIEEVKAPRGRGRLTSDKDWSLRGLKDSRVSAGTDDPAKNR